MSRKNVLDQSAQSNDIDFLKLGLNQIFVYMTGSSLRADFTIVEEFAAEREKVQSAHPLNLFCYRDKLHPPSLL